MIHTSCKEVNNIHRCILFTGLILDEAHDRRNSLRFSTQSTHLVSGVVDWEKRILLLMRTPILTPLSVGFYTIIPIDIGRGGVYNSVCWVIVCPAVVIMRLSPLASVGSTHLTI